MNISKIKINNFRMLEDVELILEKRTTLIVGRNNSGKTSTTELFRYLLSDTKPAFKLEDFTQTSHASFLDAYKAFKKNQDDSEVREKLPTIKVELEIDYASNSENHNDLGKLGDFIIDLDINCTKVIIVVTYELDDGKLHNFFAISDEVKDPDTEKKKFYRLIKDRIPNNYTVNVEAIDPTDDKRDNVKRMKLADLKALLNCGFINAQRRLDDENHNERGTLSKILETMFKAAQKETEGNDKKIVDELERSVRKTEESINVDFNERLGKLIEKFKNFGYPGEQDPELLTETELNVERLLSSNTKIRYGESDGFNLPEAYNGLGYRNLIYILLKLLEFCKVFEYEKPSPGLNLIFIEEPEVHMHPQMQENFIQHLDYVVRDYPSSQNDADWPVQFVVTTHSSHIANRADFDSIRYYFPKKDYYDDRKTEIKRLSEGLQNTADNTRDFLYKYLTLTRCDLFFANKAILIEGTSERLLLPIMIEKVDEELAENHKLSHQYITIMEVGGDYAHYFFSLIDFLELKSLIITDIDSTKKDNSRHKKHAVHGSDGTSNKCLQDFFNVTIQPEELIIKPPADMEKGLFCRVAYQIPENDDGPCGRTLEDAFMLANTAAFEITGSSVEEREVEAMKTAGGYKKTSFALEHAIEKTEWNVPKYIRKGLEWLAKRDKDSEI